MGAYIRTVLMLIVSNCLMTYAWYGHLKSMGGKSWFVTALVSWGIAFFEYMIMVPANRIGATVYTVPQLKIVQEVISLSVFVPFALFYMGCTWKWDYLWAFVCLLGAVYFMFRG
ncbi:MAG: DMT family protein [Paludibacteraceae bacterium]|nr:DMT family protein [Paludibacteraceae bacterium]